MTPVHLDPFLATLSSVGFVFLGMASWLDGDDEGDQGGGSDDDEFGEMDDFDDDEFGEMDDFDDDEFGGMDEMEGGGDASTAELETRIEDLEAEIANVSSTANTVRSENEQISEKVDEVEENVRKLLEIYEMVTRGVNPFVDDVGGGMGMGGDEGGFGLFDDTDTDESMEEEDLDDDLANAEAEDFFDDDAFDEIPDESMDGEDFDMDDEVGDVDVQTSESTEESESTDDSGGGTSFEELKEEYESGEADWADEDLDSETPDLEESEDVGFDDEADLEPTEDGEDPGEADLFQEDDLEEPLEGEDSAQDEADDGESVSTQSEGELADQDREEPPAAQTESVVSGDADEHVDQTPQSTPETTAQTDEPASEGESIGGFQFGPTSRVGHETPHVPEPPSGYLADVVVLEWLSFLLNEFDSRNAVRAINYYQRIGWIGSDMRDHLITVLMGLTDSDYLYRDEFGTTEMTMNDHMKSLEYIEELSGGNLDRNVADRLDLL